MSRYRGPKLRIVRRLDKLPGLINKRLKGKQRRKIKQRPGEHGKNRKRSSEFCRRLEEKQKLKFNYGLTENQLFKYIKEARRRKGITSVILLQLLEMRLDSICFSLGFAPTIGSARQLVNHGHIVVDDKVVNIPSFQCQINNKIGIRNKNTSKNLIQENLKIKNRYTKHILPKHLTLNTKSKKIEGYITNFCSRKDIGLKIDELLVIEYYSRR